jgi:hypothetical protein
VVIASQFESRHASRVLGKTYQWCLGLN